MADRFPLIVDPTTNRIKEIPDGDNLNLSGNDIVNAENITATTFFGDGSNLTGINAETLDGIDSSKFLKTDSAGQKTSGTLTFNDSVILSFGTSDDAELFCNGSHLYLDLNSGIGNFYIRDGTTTRFTFDDNGDFTATGDINSGSDVKLKTNIKTLTNSLDKVVNLRGVEYDRIDMDNKHQIGVIAQEVEEILPELVGENNGVKTVSYGNITALLIEAIKEQQEQINYLKSKLEELEK